MAKVVRPLRFDKVRRQARNNKRSVRRRELKARRQRLARAIYRMTWFGNEPDTMWMAGDPTNDNERQH